MIAFHSCFCYPTTLNTFEEVFRYGNNVQHVKRPCLVEGSPWYAGRLLQKLLAAFSWLLLKKPKSLLPSMLRLLIPHGPRVFPYILDLTPKLAFTSCPPMNLAFFGTGLTMVCLSVCRSSLQDPQAYPL